MNWGFAGIVAVCHDSLSAFSRCVSLSCCKDAIVFGEDTAAVVFLIACQTPFPHVERKHIKCIASTLCSTVAASVHSIYS